MILVKHTMNFYSFTGDILHIFILTFLPLAIWKTESCAGISGKTQLLLALIHIARCFLNLFLIFISLYNTLVQIHLIIMLFVTLYFICFRFRETYDHENDRFPSELLVVAAMILAYFIRYDHAAVDYWWTFSIYLESIAIVPQLYMTYKSGKTRTLISVYVLFLTLYRSFYITNYIYCYNSLHISRYYKASKMPYQAEPFDFISFSSASVQVLMYVIYFVILLINRCKSKPLPLNIYVITEPPLILTKDVDVQKENLLSYTEENK